MFLSTTSLQPGLIRQESVNIPFHSPLPEKAVMYCSTACSHQQSSFTVSHQSDRFHSLTSQRLYLQTATHLSSRHRSQSTLQHQWKVQLQGLMLDFLRSAWPLPQQRRSHDPEREVRPMRQTRPVVPAVSVRGSASQKLGDLEGWRVFGKHGIHNSYTTRDTFVILEISLDLFLEVEGNSALTARQVTSSELRECGCGRGRDAYMQPTWWHRSFVSYLPSFFAVLRTI